MKPELWQMLMDSAKADKSKAELTLNLLSSHPAGIGDHSTTDFYENAEEALKNLVDAVDRINLLNKLNSKDRINLLNKLNSNKEIING